MNRSGQLQELFPRPLVVVAVLLGILILLTPVLTTEGQPAAGSIFSQAELVIDDLPGNYSAHFYVHGLSTTARYTDIQLAFAYGFNWTGRFPSGPLNWTDWQNGSEVLSVEGFSNSTPVAVNVSALYIANGVSALYMGVLAVDVGYPVGSTVQTLFVVSDTSGITSFTTPVVDLPIPITLANVATGATR